MVVSARIWESVEELTHPVSVERVSLFLYTEPLKHLEVALGPLGIGVKWGHRPPAQLLVIIHILQPSRWLLYISITNENIQT